MKYLKLRDENDENALNILATFSDQSLGFGPNIEDITVILTGYSVGTTEGVMCVI